MILLAIVLLFGQGCRTHMPFGGAARPSDQRMEVKLDPTMRDAIVAALENRASAIPSALEAMPEEGISVWVDFEGYIFGPDGTPIMDKDGNPLKFRAQVVAKLNSLKNLQEMKEFDEFELTVGGDPNVRYRTEQTKHIPMLPTVFHAYMKRGSSVSGTSHVPAMREAAARERQAIIESLSAYTKARGEAFATKVEALSDGTYRILTATGRQILGRVTGTYAVDAGIEGAGRLLGAVIDTGTGTENVVCEGDDCKLIVVE